MGAADEFLVVGVLRQGTVCRDGLECLDEIAEDTLQRCAANEKTLTALDMSETVFTPLFIAELSEAVCHNTVLQELYLNSCLLGDEGARMLAQGFARNGHCNLKVLAMNCCQISCRGATNVARILDVAEHRYSRTFGGYRTPATGPGRGLEYLSLKGNSVASVGVKAIAQVLMKCDDSLRELDLEGNRICDWGAGWLALALRNHAVLRSLRLCGNPIGNDGIEEITNACLSAQASLIVATPAANAAGFLESTEVQGQREATVYVTKVSDDSLDTWSAMQSSFSRPHSASRRQLLGCTQACSATSLGGFYDVKPQRVAPMSEDTDPPKPKRPSSAGRCGQRGVGVRRAQPPWKARCKKIHPQPKPSTYAAHWVPFAGVTAEPLPCQLLPPARDRPGERSLGADEKEIAAMLVSPTRWRRKPRSVPPCMPLLRRESLSLREPVSGGHSQQTTP